MTRIDFYQIDSDEAPLIFTCRLIDKIYHLGHKIHIHTMDQAQSQALDDLLWNFKPERFIPHAICSNVVENGLHEKVKVKICHQSEPLEHKDIMINLSGTVPDFFSRFERVAEVVPLDKQSRTSARENYRFYKDRGYELQYHQMKARK
ncbi:MAG: DNA polymerase III subunit chi [Pseudomonadales bacterium]|nr:DNA polymerase III subunit chi [Pseudomonadales bacterium]